MKKLILFLTPLLLTLASCTRCSSKQIDEPRESTANVVYKSTDAKFPNPERGFYDHTSCNLGTGTDLLKEYDIKECRKRNITLIFRYFYLKDFRDKPLSAKALEDFDKDMETLRKTGAKCVLRFAYSSRQEEPDAPFSTISQHLDQLKPYLEKNTDVIAVLQAGFIGAWGEWYYTTNGLNTPGGRYQVLDKILQTLPENRIVQVRTPGYKKEFFQRTTPLKQEEAFTKQRIARVGHHNDCFLASPNDYGTYENVEADKAYLNKECLYVPIGGETCPPNGIDPADGLKAYNEMRNLRWTYLNEDYYTPVNNLWIANGYMDKIIRELGYRFELVSGDYTDKTAPGNQLSARIILKNVGFAPLYNERNVELILKSKESKEIYKVKLDLDPRYWKPGSETEIDIVAGIPASIDLGDYDLYLNMPDIAETLYGNPDFSIRFANENVWEAETGYNNLLMSVSIEEDAGKAYTGNNYFMPVNR